MEIVKGEGIVFDLSETRRIPVVNGGGSIYWDADFQGMLRTDQYGGDWARFFPKAEIIEGVQKVRFSYIECNNAKEAMSRTRGINEGGEDKAGIRRSELEAFFKAIEDIHKLEETATEPDKKSFIRNLRLPDPTISPEKYRIYIGSDGKEHLAVLWGYERIAEHDCCDTHPIDEFKRKFVKFVLPDTVDKLKFIHKVILGVTALLIAILIIVLIAKAFSHKEKEPSTVETPIVNTTDGGNGQSANIGLGTPTPVGDNNGATSGSNGNSTNTQNSTNGNGAANGNGSTRADNGNSIQPTQAGQQSGANASSSKENSIKAENNGIIATDGSESTKQQNTETEKNSSATNAKDKNTSESSTKKSDENTVKSTEKNSNVAKDQSKSGSSTVKKDENNAKNVNESTAKAQEKAQATNGNATAKSDNKAENTAVAPVKIAKTENEAILGSRNDVRLKISDMTLQKKKVMVTLMLDAISSVKDSKISEITMDGKKPEKLSGGKAIFMLDLNHRYKVQGRIEYDKNGQKYTNSIDDFLQLNLGATLDSAKE